MAIVDLTFCVITLFDSIFLDDNLVYRDKNASYFFTLYGIFFQNTLIKMSTWCTVIMAISRHMVVCYPMKARQFMKPVHTVVAIITTLTIWIFLHLPALWTWTVKSIACSQDRTIFLLSAGYLMEQLQVRRAFMMTWFILGFVIPFIILLICNIRLIKSLNTSNRLRNNSLSSSNIQHETNRRITITLIGIILMFFVCVCPSEIVHFYSDQSFGARQGNSLSLVLTACNMIQVINFSGNFALYFSANLTFRRGFWQLVRCRRQGHVTASNSVIGGGSGSSGKRLTTTTML